MGDALNAGGFRITNIATPVDATDAVNKTFADAQVAFAQKQGELPALKSSRCGRLVLAFPLPAPRIAEKLWLRRRIRQG